MQETNSGHAPPVIHVDTDAPLFSDVDGSLISSDMWGIYYKPDFNFDGIQGGAAPFSVEKNAVDVAVDPYGPESPEFVVGADFAHMCVSALAHCQKRFSGTMPHYKDEPSGGIGAFTPDSFPVFDRIRDNCYLIADSNHGYKMLGAGKLVAAELCGTSSDLLKPFRFPAMSRANYTPSPTAPSPGVERRGQSAPYLAYTALNNNENEPPVYEGAWKYRVRRSACIYGSSGI